MNTYTKAALAVALTALAVISAAVIFTPDADDTYAYAEDTVAVVVDQNGVETEYPSLEAAVDAAEEGQTVRLVLLMSELQYTLSKSIILDLNGQSIHYAGNALTVAGGADVLIKNGSLNCRIAGNYYALTVSEGATVTAYNVTFYGKLNNAGNLTLCQSTTNNQIINTGGEFISILSTHKHSLYQMSFISEGDATVYASYIDTTNGRHVFNNMGSVKIYGAYVSAGYGYLFSNVSDLEIYGGYFMTANGPFFLNSTVVVHAGIFDSSDSYKRDVYLVAEGHDAVLSASGRYLSIMPDASSCSGCYNLDWTSGFVDNEDDMVHRDLVCRTDIKTGSPVVILSFDLHELCPSVYGENEYSYSLCSHDVNSYYLLSKGGASYTNEVTSNQLRAWHVTEHTASSDPNTPGSGSGADDDDAGDLPPNVGPSASNSASGSSDSRTISIIAAAVVVIAMGVGALFVFREH